MAKLKITFRPILRGTKEWHECEIDRFKRMKQKCDSCGESGFDFLTSSSHSDHFKTYKGRKLYLNYSFTIDKADYGFMRTSKIKHAGLCNKCSRKLLLKSAWWPGRLKVLRNWFTFNVWYPLRGRRRQKW